jgi:hypothetical protein
MRGRYCPLSSLSLLTILFSVLTLAQSGNAQASGLNFAPAVIYGSLPPATSLI